MNISTKENYLAVSENDVYRIAYFQTKPFRYSDDLRSILDTS